MIVCQKKQIEMINKKSAFIFILFANIIILAHGFVPHLHSIHQVFIISHNQTHKHAATNHKREHDTKNDNKYCLLNQIIGIRANTEKQIFNQDGYADIDTNLEWFPAALTYNEFNDNSLSTSIQLLPPLLNFTYTSYTIGALGLRGPPAV